MEASVRYIPTDMAVVDNKPYQIGNKPALCFRGKTYALGIVSEEDSINLVTLTLYDHDKSPLVQYGIQEEYPVGKFISHMERIMADKPITPEALELMKQWPNNPEDFGDPVVPDDPGPTLRIRRTKKTKLLNCIALISGEMGIAATKIRKFLRSKGFNAPYENEKKIRTALKNYK